ncbi:MAG: DUF262 domain-containing protein [Bacteroidetes bacterium]|nr:DUF262 domain-containing protein [Bacteroidota bacterium]
MTKEELEFEEKEEEEPTQILPKERRVYSDKTDRSIFELYRQYQKGNLELHPEFQRLQVWDNRKSSRLIESVLMEVPIPVIYLSEESDEKYSVIDGQQRLNAFFIFFENKLRLRGLMVLPDLNGKKYHELLKNLQNKFENATIRIIVIRKESQVDVKFEIFERLNTGAVQLNAQELRNCIYRGRYNELLKDLSTDKDFLSLLGLKGPHHRMQDRELILRFFAFFHNTHLKYTPSMKHFLNKEMERYINLLNNEDNELRKIFKKSVILSKTVFGDKAFRRFVSGSGKDPNGYWETRKINKGLFDVIMFGFTMYEKNQIIPNSDSIREELLWLMTSSPFIDSISGSGTDSKIKIQQKFEVWLNSLRRVIGYPEKEPRNYTLNLKKQLWESNPTCAICGQRIHLIDDAEIDHIEQYWRGGKTIPTNSRLTHRYCNRSRSLDDTYGIVGKKSLVYPRPMRKPRTEHPKPDEKITQDQLIPVIIKVLGKFRGKATKQQVEENINDLFYKEYEDSYYQETVGHGVPRWKHNIAWSKERAKHQGLIKPASESGRGYWELTQEGEKYFRRIKNNNENK